jgi:hypothetical protein
MFRSKMPQHLRRSATLRIRPSLLRLLPRPRPGIERRRNLRPQNTRVTSVLCRDMRMPRRRAPGTGVTSGDPTRTDSSSRENLGLDQVVASAMPPSLVLLSLLGRLSELQFFPQAGAELETGECLPILDPWKMPNYKGRVPQENLSHRMQPRPGFPLFIVCSSQLS